MGLNVVLVSLHPLFSGCRSWLGVTAILKNDPLTQRDTCWSYALGLDPALVAGSPLLEGSPPTSVFHLFPSCSL